MDAQSDAEGRKEKYTHFVSSLYKKIKLVW